VWKEKGEERAVRGMAGLFSNRSSFIIFISSFIDLTPDHWLSLNNQRKALDNIAKKHGFDPLVAHSWYTFPKSILSKEKVFTTLPFFIIFIFIFIFILFLFLFLFLFMPRKEIWGLGKLLDFKKSYLHESNYQNSTIQIQPPKSNHPNPTIQIHLSKSTSRSLSEFRLILKTCY
jgi:hypothetical protein